MPAINITLKLNNMDIFQETKNGLSLSLDRISKANISNLSSSVIHNVMEGNEYALDQYIKAKGISEVAGAIMDGLKDLAINEAENYTANDKVNGCTFQIKSTAATYDFSHNDEWALLNAQLDSIKKQMKEIEQKMIDATKYAEVIDDRTGEVIPPAIVKKVAGTTIAIAIPKD